MKIGDEVYIHGFVDEIRKDTVIIRNEGGYFGTLAEEVSLAEEALKQESQTGHWLYSGENGIDRWTCDNCFTTTRNPTKACPSCKAKMGSE